MPTSKEVGIVKTTEVSAVVGGALTIQGWAAGVFFAARQLNNAFVDEQGASQEVGMVLSGDGRYEIDITLLQTSKDNDALSVLHQTFLKTAVMFPFNFDDASGRTIAAGASAAFRKFPDVTYNKEGVESRVWTLFIPHLEIFVGGNKNAAGV
jgi:hypothetical protein